MGAPLGQVSRPYAHEFWLRFEDVKQDRFADEHVRFVQGTAASLDAQTKSLTYQLPDGSPVSEPYDVLVVAAGIRRASPIIPQSKDGATYRAESDAFIDQLESAQRIVIVGGGMFRSCLP
jgi:apoptosis-inducing factor 2